MPVNQDQENHDERYLTQREKARIHTEDIIYALRALGRARSGKINKYIHDNIAKVLQEQFENNPWNKVQNGKNVIVS